MKKLIAALALAATAAGCFTFNEADFPVAHPSALPASATNETVAVNGFEATLTEYVSVYGYSTVYVPGHLGRRHYHPGHYETMSTSTQVPQLRPDGAFLARAQSILEESGYNLRASTPKWVVEVHFACHGATSGESSLRALWVLGTAFLCDYAAETWSAKLKIYDNATGRLVFHNDYVQKYETNVFSPIPLFGITACDKTTPNYRQSWCLTALTDRTMADATAFLAAQAAR